MNAKALIAAGAAALIIAGAALAQPPARPGDPLAGKSVTVTLVTEDGVALSETDHGVANTRMLKFGEEYAPGWKLEQPTPVGIGIRNGNVVRVIPYAAGAAPASTADAGAAAGQVNLSNAVQGERSARTGQVVDRAKLVTAVAAGDVRQAYDLGGSAADVAQALAASMNNPRMTEALANGGQASFINMNGNTGVRVSSNQDGRNMQFMMVPQQLQGVAPPPDAQTITPPPITAGGQEQVTTDGNGNTIVRRSLSVPAPPN